jgi:6-pyruvoyl-tetrahydropterin synthase
MANHPHRYKATAKLHAARLRKKGYVVSVEELKHHNVYKWVVYSYRK